MKRGEPVHEGMTGLGLEKVVPSSAAYQWPAGASYDAPWGSARDFLRSPIGSTA